MVEGHDDSQEREKVSLGIYTTFKRQTYQSLLMIDIMRNWI